MNDIYDDFLKAVKHEKVSRIPTVLWDNAIPITRLAGVQACEYYASAEVKLKTQLKLIDAFPEILWIPGIFADYGVVTGASAFGCKIQWFADSSPYAHPVLTNIHEVHHMKPINPNSDGLMPKALKEYEYFWEHTDRYYIEKYHYLEGIAVSLGPMELAGTMRGYDKFCLDLIDYPNEVHNLLKIITEGITSWLRAQEKINGKLRLLIIPDHFPSQISLPMFEEFGNPYLQEIFSSFPQAICLYHNEGSSMHYLERIPELDVDIFHCGKVDLVKAKKKIGRDVCLMGNLDAVAVKDSSSDMVKQLALDCLKMGAQGGGHLLSIGGAMAPDTPPENLRALVEAVKEFSIVESTRYQAYSSGGF